MTATNVVNKEQLGHEAVSEMYSMLMRSGSVNRIKAIHISERHGRLTLKTLLSVHGDHRNHWITDDVNDSKEAFFIMDTLMDQHETFHPEDKQEIGRWRAALSDTSAYTNGISLYYGT